MLFQITKKNTCTRTKKQFYKSLISSGDFAALKKIPVRQIFHLQKGAILTNAIGEFWDIDVLFCVERR